MPAGQPASLSPMAPARDSVAGVSLPEKPQTSMQLLGETADKDLESAHPENPLQEGEFPGWGSTQGTCTSLPSFRRDRSPAPSPFHSGVQG